MTIGGKKVLFGVFNRLFDTIEDAIGYCNSCDFSIEFIICEEV